ncbi:MAG: 3-hydroxylacyl-ACP dehydratase [Georgfuchsia sp.]
MLTAPLPPLDRDWIATHIPHQGSMCLLDAVSAWSPTRIRCTASSHRDPSNPLRSGNRLGIACGIEYAAQAMAIHGALLAASDQPPHQGYLVSVRNVSFGDERLDQIDAALQVDAERLTGDDNTVLYQFHVRSPDQLLLSGRAAVVLDADLL